MFLVQRYSPARLEDLYLPEESRLLLLASLRSLDNLNLLLIGGASTGKTTLIDILLHEYYGAASAKELERNVLYVSSLREQGLQFFRQEIKTFCQTYSCIAGRKKCVVIDDLDLVNEQSQQVFRNFVDRYSHRVHFLASCSNPQKVIDPLLSRLLCLQLSAVPDCHMQQLLDRVCQAESIPMTPEAKEFLVRLSRHSGKVMLHFLEKVLLVQHALPEETVTLDRAQELCCDIPFAELEALIVCLQQPQDGLPEAVRRLMQLYARGFSVVDILDNLHTFLRMTPLLTEQQKHAVIPCLCKYIAVFHNLHEDDLELIFFANQMQQCLATC